MTSRSCIPQTQAREKGRSKAEGLLATFDVASYLDYHLVDQLRSWYRDFGTRLAARDIKVMTAGQDDAGRSHR